MQAKGAVLRIDGIQYFQFVIDQRCWPPDCGIRAGEPTIAGPVKAECPVHHGRRESVTKKVGTRVNPVDLMTKPLPRIELLTNMMGFVERYKGDYWMVRNS